MDSFHKWLGKHGQHLRHLSFSSELNQQRVLPCPNLTKLELRGEQVLETVYPLLRALKSLQSLSLGLKSLQSLSLGYPDCYDSSSNRVMPEPVPVAVLQTMPDLTQLKLSGVSVVGGLHQLSTVSSLRDLHVRELPTTCFADMQDLQRLTSMSLEADVIGDPFELSWVDSPPLRGAPLYDPDRFSGLTSNTALRMLQLKFIRLPSKAWQHVFGPSTHLPQLQSLELQEPTPKLDTADLQSICKSCPALDSLGLFRALRPQGPDDEVYKADIAVLQQVSRGPCSKPYCCLTAVHCFLLSHHHWKNGTTMGQLERHSGSCNARPTHLSNSDCWRPTKCIASRWLQ
jgi:hypothetical protein